MKKSCFNAGWTFARRGQEAAAVPVTLPHDAMLSEPRSRDAATGAGCGYFPGGAYVYTKRFSVPEEWREKHIVLECEGVYKNASVSLNGKELARQAYGYSNFFVPLDEALRFGEENELVLVADNSACPNSRWYSGSGVYRNVNLYEGEKAFIAPDGLAIRAEKNGAVQVELTVSGGDAAKVTILDGEKVLAEAEATVADGRAVLTLQADGVTPWSAESPRLYCCKAELSKDNAVNAQSFMEGLRNVDRFLTNHSVDNQ